MDSHSTFKLHTGREMPVIGLGTWELKNDTSGSVAEAIKLGYRMIDTSGDYGTEPGIGEAIKKSGVDRAELYLVTKVEEDEDAYDSTRRNMGKMEQDYADLMLIHRPPSSGAGKALWKGLIDAREDGLTVDIGVSNYSIDQIEALIEATGETPVVNQIEWTPFGWSEEMLDYCRGRGIIIQAYSPLTRQERLSDDRLEEIASEYGKTPAQVVLRWNLQMGVVPLPKANSREHQQQNLDVFDFEISEEHMRELNAFNEHYSALGELQYV